MKDSEVIYHPQEGEYRIPNRPLGPVSNFVVEQLPVVLERIRADRTSASDLIEQVDSLITILPFGTVRRALTSPYQCDLASLDLKMLEAGIVHSNLIPGSSLIRLVDEFSEATDQPPGLTYEEIVMINPLSDRRIFTRGEVGKTEARFYQAHRIIEEHLASVTEVVRAGIFSLVDGQSDTEEVAKSLVDVQRDIRSVVGYTHSLGLQNREHFSEFRMYLNSHPLRGTKGPSGAFTAGVPTLELLLAGNVLPEAYMGYLQENYQYFPRQGRKEIDEARALVQKGLTLVSLSQRFGNPPALENCVRDFSQLIRLFRGEHYKTVKNQVPEALSGQVTGTGGEQNPGTFLRERIKIGYI